MTKTLHPIPRLARGALLGVALLLPGVAAAGAGAVVQAVESKYATVSGMKAKFTQTVKSAIYGDETQQGEVTLKRPAKMRWTFSGDGKQFVTDGETMWIYNAPDNQVIRYDDVSAQAGSAQTLLTSLDRIGELFVISELPDDQGHTLELQPRKGDAQFKRVELHLDDKLVVEKVVITDPFDTVTELVFDQVTLDPKVSDDLFEFQVPAGAEVIDAGSP